MLSKKYSTHFQDKVVWITGASSGIGRALTIALSKTNAKAIYITARSVTKLEQTIEQSAKTNIIMLPGDLTDKSTNQDIIQTIESSENKLDIAILNAGTCEYVEVDTFDSSLFERQMKTNFMSMIYAIEAALPLLKRTNNSQLIGMSSTAAYTGLPRAEAYGATKAAIRSLFQSLQVTLRAINVKSSVICPGFVETELTAQNDFNMPGIISAELAAEEIMRGIAKEQHEIHFPKTFSYTLKFIAALPSPIKSWLLTKSIART